MFKTQTLVEGKFVKGKLYNKSVFINSFIFDNGSHTVSPPITVNKELSKSQVAELIQELQQIHDKIE